MKFLNLIQDTKRLEEDKTYVKWHLVHRVHDKIRVKLAIVGGDCIARDKAQELMTRALKMWVGALEERAKANKVKLLDKPLTTNIEYIDGGDIGWRKANGYPEENATPPSQPTPGGDPFDPNNPGFDPNNPGFDPNNPGFDPNNPGFDPNNPSFDPAGTSTYPDFPAYGFALSNKLPTSSSGGSRDNKNTSDNNAPNDASNNSDAQKFDYDLHAELNCKIVTQADVSSGKESPGKTMPVADRPHILYIPRHAEDLRISYKDGEVYNDFVFNVIVHELGHVFGLSDTYKYSAKEPGPEDGRYGRQPPSMMSKPWDFKGLADDDKDGMVWLYKYFVSKEFNDVTQCLDGYTYDDETGGCLSNQATSDNNSSNSSNSNNKTNSRKITPDLPASAGNASGRSDMWCHKAGSFREARGGSCEKDEKPLCFNGGSFGACKATAARASSTLSIDKPRPACLPYCYNGKGYELCKSAQPGAG